MHGLRGNGPKPIDSQPGQSTPKDGWTKGKQPGSSTSGFQPQSMYGGNPTASAASVHLPLPAGAAPPQTNVPRFHADDIPMAERGAGQSRTAGSEEGNAEPRPRGFWSSTKGRILVAGLGVLGAGGAAGGVGTYLSNRGRGPLTLNGSVRTATGTPIEGADCSLVNLGKTARTDAEGRFDFSDGKSNPKPAKGETLHCTHPDFHGGLGGINSRTIASYADTAHLRMFSSDPAWTERCGGGEIRMNYAAAPELEGKYHQIMGGDPAEIHRRLSTEACQTMFTDPSNARKLDFLDISVRPIEAPAVANAQTGRNSINMGSDFVRDMNGTNPSARTDLHGVAAHEHAHIHQSRPANEIPGNKGFLESSADTVMALNGFGAFHSIDLSKGAKCIGSPTEPYAEGARYLAFIELKHPGSLAKILDKSQFDNFETRVKKVTGENLSDLAEECRTKGMP